MLVYSMEWYLSIQYFKPVHAHLLFSPFVILVYSEKELKCKNYLISFVSWFCLSITFCSNHRLDFIYRCDRCVWWCCHHKETFSALLAFFEGNPLSPIWFYLFTTSTHICCQSGKHASMITALSTNNPMCMFLQPSVLLTKKKKK